MPTVISCPHCRASLRVPDEYLGKRAQCAQCQKQFVAKADAPAPTPEPVTRSPRPRVTAGNDLEPPNPLLGLLHILPAVLLAAGLVGVLVRDARWDPATAGGGGSDEKVVELPIDPVPLLEARFDPQNRFGLVLPRELDAWGKPKRLTYSEIGGTNNTCVRVDGEDRIFGFAPGEWRVREAEPPRRADGKAVQGRICVWEYVTDQVLVTQTVEIVPGEQTSASAERRFLDTCRVVYRIENRDRKSHNIGLRFLLDTYIGSNDGVPFTIPGVRTLCDTMYDFPRPSEVPDFIQALESGDIDKPGTVAHLTLQLGGGIEAPSRVLLSQWRNVVAWDVPGVAMDKDSGVTMYWPEESLGPGKSRSVGFALGLGNLTSGGSGRLALTLGGRYEPGREFTVTAYVRDPAPGQTLKLELPPGLQLSGGEAEQTVPPLPALSTNRNSPVTWRVRAVRPGTHTLTVRSSTGGSQSQPVVVPRATSIFD